MELFNILNDQTRASENGTVSKKKHVSGFRSCVSVSSRADTTATNAGKKRYHHDTLVCKGNSSEDGRQGV